MGSALTRHLRDLGDVGGFETFNGSLTGSAVLAAETQASSEIDTHPSTPTAIRKELVLDYDPRSPTAEIVRTPIEVTSRFFQRKPQDSPMSNALHVRRSYLETDLDTLSTSESALKPEHTVNEDGSSLPPGLTGAHLMKLRFLGLDPRSPSSDIVRTPIQLGKNHQRNESPVHFDDTLSVGSVSSQDIFNNSVCSSEFTRDCSDPSALVSELEDGSDKEEESNVSILKQDCTPKSSVNISKDDSPTPFSTLFNDEINQSMEGQPKAVTKLRVFQENELSESDEKSSLATPDGTKKTAGNRSRTPLTPICNRSRTPNSILRARQSQTIEKELFTKAKIFSTEDNVMTPSKIRPLGSSKKENTNGGARSGRKGLATNNENLSISNAKKQSLVQWDQDSSVII